MAEILNGTTIEGTSKNDAGYWLPTESTLCGKGNYYGQDLEGYSSPKLWYDAKISELCELINSFVGDDGTAIPIILRLFHEAEDSWTWWGTPYYSSKGIYIEFMRYTIAKIRTLCPHKNILFAYCRDIYWENEEEFLDRYPGDEYIDVIGYDDYSIGLPNISNDIISNRMRIISNIANERMKVAALFETGNRTQEQKEENMLNDYLYESLSANMISFGMVQLWASFVVSTTLQNNDYNKFLNRNDIKTFKDGDNITEIKPQISIS